MHTDFHTHKRLLRSEIKCCLICWLAVCESVCWRVGKMAAGHRHGEIKKGRIVTHLVKIQTNYKPERKTKRPNKDIQRERNRKRERGMTEGDCRCEKYFFHSDSSRDSTQTHDSTSADAACVHSACICERERQRERERPRQAQSLMLCLLLSRFLTLLLNAPARKWEWTHPHKHTITQTFTHFCAQHASRFQHQRRATCVQHPESIHPTPHTYGVLKLNMPLSRMSASKFQLKLFFLILHKMLPGQEKQAKNSNHYHMEPELI